MGSLSFLQGIFLTQEELNWDLLHCRQILQQLSSQGSHSLEGLMLKLKLLTLWPPDAKSQLIRKDFDAVKH